MHRHSHPVGALNKGHMLGSHYSDGTKLYKLLTQHHHRLDVRSFHPGPNALEHKRNQAHTHISLRRPRPRLLRLRMRHRSLCVHWHLQEARRLALGHAVPDHMERPRDERRHHRSESAELAAPVQEIPRQHVRRRYQAEVLLCRGLVRPKQEELAESFWKGH